VFPNICPLELPTRAMRTHKNPRTSACPTTPQGFYARRGVSFAQAVEAGIRDVRACEVRAPPSPLGVVR
jgi:hypothetical protein